VTNLAILISGQGSNMASLVRAHRERRWPARVVAVIASRETAPGLALARELGVPAEAMPHAVHTGREDFDDALAARLDALDAGVVALAGFMRILGDRFVRRFDGRLVNVHPSLLPAFPGLDTHARALASGVRMHGATVHLVATTVDDGPILAQAAVPVRDGDDPRRLAARVLRAEHRIFPDAVGWMIEGRVSVVDGRARIDGIDASRRLLWRTGNERRRNRRSGGARHAGRAGRGGARGAARRRRSGRRGRAAPAVAAAAGRGRARRGERAAARRPRRHRAARVLPREPEARPARPRRGRRDRVRRAPPPATLRAPRAVAARAARVAAGVAVARAPVRRAGDRLDAPAAGDRRRAALRAFRRPGRATQAVRLSLPDWLHEILLAQAADDGEGSPHAAVERLGRALLEPAPLDLRANLLKTDRAAAAASLAVDGVRTDPVPDVPTALRVRGKPALERTGAFERGEVEVQDAGSQRLVAFAAPKRGATVVDFCAGAGGKTLAMAAAMRSSGQVFACDVSNARLARLKPRLARSGATSVQPFGLDSEHDPKLGRLAGRADLVLVDAPCSGTGTLRRNPEIKWRTQPAAIDSLVATQGSILAAAARLVKRGGVLVYGTCSLVRRENEGVADAFAAAHPGFREDGRLRLSPDRDACDGFFAVRWIRAD
jgi:16S rRNA (cytosine967-C5)-methyltransferase